MLFTWKWTLETIPLNNERLSLVKTKLPIKTSTPITNLHELIRNEFQILYVRKLKENGVNVSEVLYNFPPDILNTTFFRLLRTIKRYYNNRWSFWAAILIRSSLAVWRRGGGEYLTKVLYGRFRLKVQPLTLLYTIFDRKDPFRLRSIDKCYPFHPHSLEIWTPFLTAVNALSLKHELITKLESFMDFFTSIKRICRPFRAFLQTEMTDFPTLLSVASTSDSLPYHIPEA